MKKNSKVLTALVICGALNFGLTNDAQATEFDSSLNVNGSNYQELARSPKYGSAPPRHNHWRGMFPPPMTRPHRDYWEGYQAPPGHRPPPPPPPQPPHRW